MKKKLSINHIARIEGHGSVRVVLEDGGVSCVEMQVTEATRCFEALTLGRHFSELAFITSRICGICSPSHTVTSLAAIEAAFEVVPSKRTQQLRELLVYGSFLQNHATHLYMLAAPDYIRQDDILPLAESKPEAFQAALSLKQLGNDLCRAVGGRSVHPISAVVGGFTAEPLASELDSLADRLDAAAEAAAATCDTFRSFAVPEFATQGEFLSLYDASGYAVQGGEMRAALGAKTASVADYAGFITELPVAHSNAKASTIDGGRTYFTGALARVNNSWDRLSQQAKLAAAKVGLRPIELNSFYNNLAQAVELVDAALRCSALCRALAASPPSAEDNSSVVDFAVRSSEGIAATEAPRGLLLHHFSFDEGGFVTAANIVTPTAQSLANLEHDIRLLAPQIAHYEPEEFKLTIGELVRAYDPCLSCAVH